MTGHDQHGLLSLGYQKQLFLDDGALEDTYKVGRVYHRPMKLSSNPVLKRGSLGDFPHNCLGTVLFDKGLFKMWYHAGRFRAPMNCPRLG